ncbi:MAG: SHOCT domain-containing protein [Dehalococcoidia bacterium]|nr:MAG: SHOCT domain-containing protein [Dehalococcoidia bacterium]
MMWHAGDGMGWWMLWGGLMMILFWGAIIALIVWAIQTVTRREFSQTQSPHTGPSARTPVDIAKERSARGDISRKEFEQIKRDLEEP